MSVSLSQQDLEKELGSARVAVERSGLPSLLAEIDRGAFGTTPLNLQALDAVAHALAAGQAFWRVAEAQGLPAPLVGFLFAEEAADRLAPLAEAPVPDGAALALKEYQDLKDAAPGRVLDTLLRDLCGFVRFYQRHPESAKRLARDAEAARCLSAYFRLASRTLKKLYGTEGGPKVETPRVRLDGWKALPAASEEPTQLLPVSLEDIVGNEDLVKAATRLARDVAGFDPKTGANPKKVRNPVLFSLGTPGCGKTVTAHAVGRYFLDLCAKAGLPARFRVIRRTDWASSYQNQSANRLLEIFKEEVFNAPGVCGAYWPDIDTAFAARGDSDIRQEEKANLAALFGILDGTIGPKNGKWFLLCDANNLHMDEATLSRISQNPIKALGPTTAADFVKILRGVKLRGKDRWLPLSDADWEKVGAACVERKLSGRSADNIAGRILTEIEDFEEPPEYFAADFAEKQRMIERLARPVSAARVLEMIDAHCRFERDAQTKADEDRFQSRVREIRFHLSTQRAALSEELKK